MYGSNNRKAQIKVTQSRTSCGQEIDDCVKLELHERPHNQCGLSLVLAGMTASPTGLGPSKAHPEDWWVVPNILPVFVSNFVISGQRGVRPHPAAERDATGNRI